MSRIHVDGASYQVRIGGSGPPLLLIHGFTGRASDWGPFLPALQQAATTITVDLLGHGDSDSPAEPARHAIERQAADLAAVLRRIGAAPADVAGYSLGARVALRMAAASSGVVRRLMLESPSAGIADPADRAARRDADEQLARLLESRGMQAFVERWESLPFFASERALPAASRARLHAERLRNRREGLAACLRGAGQGSMEPLDGRLGGVKSPTLVVAGALDETGRLRAEAIAAGIPRARLVIVEKAGHAPHREAPGRFASLLLEFIARAPAGAPPPSGDALPAARRDTERTPS
ncbi:MAG: 2-succinyl-6-hydroxy-2,4-cyclohexadiene-1-carboxylate synthase [Candidatus Limnocylindrales bacterium]|jgi:2-succinyl-6-hydroxy-2,4-cyclohexadiene-1-carboxylate synthase